MASEQQGREQRLASAARALNIALNSSQAQTLLAYMAQMQRWNRTYNLTALRDGEQILVQHVFDSLSVVEPMRKAIAQRRLAAPCIVDVGSGGGLPGVVVAAIHADWQVSCVDAVEKKMAFVRQMSSVLPLPNLHAVHGRIEALPPFKADIVVSRAFASLSDFARLAGRHVGPDGYLLAMKGREPQDEIDLLQQSTPWSVDHIEPLIVPELNAQRCLVWMSCRQGTL
jgi:16S rRNA (guanine527-N7)-methyltransferase